MLALLAQVTEDAVDNIPTETINVDSGTATGIFAAGMGIFVLIMVLALATAIFNIWMIIDAATRKEDDFVSGSKNMWLILLIVGFFVGFGFIVSLIYFFAVKRKSGSTGGAATPPQSTGGTETPAQ